MAISIREAARVKPAPRQLAWQSLEFYAFIHFTVNTFTDREWGLGDESPVLFQPTELDARQWVAACKSAGMKALILTCKHHDGFCLWPSAVTEHSVKNSPWRGGHGDLVREVSDACREAGLKFGIYLSPWDRHEPSYGDSDAYNNFFAKQLTELLTGYGELFSVWFDGACGEGPNGKRQVYDWDRYYAMIREHQPNAVISVCGPDVRWCGNEAGHTRTSEWSVVPASLQDNEKIQEKSQSEDDGIFASRINSDEDDLGSRSIIEKAEALVWYPAEVNTSIRPGWFYHASENDKVKSPDELMELYERTVGGNSAFLLNLPPDRRGLIHEQDVRSLAGLGERIRRLYSRNLAANAAVKTSASLDAEHGGPAVFSAADTYWSAPEGAEQAELEFDLGGTQTFNRIVLQEHISVGQRVEAFRIEVLEDEEVLEVGNVNRDTTADEMSKSERARANESEACWRPIYKGTVIGYKHICRFPPVAARRIRLVIEQSRWCPTLQTFEVYHYTLT
ncbi:alpha-fucosidase [Paenibacillus yonginensis]|uniref:alpha-L-fucosidase n=1 Tax=Paenibacillus yonginensis TaxID=1462996 RepID=A0A1B1MVT5_9BACL|nr:alpha-L-fucosidase [Paenibacillus yonginensis]ANS73265.1 alpha-fucosidase [Paenibacillus yonginensis]